METCALTQRLVPAEWLGTCAVSRKRRSDVSDALAEPDLLVISEISPRSGCPRSARCDFSGKAVLVDEIVMSQISGRPLRKDEVVVSAISEVSGPVSEMVKCEASGAYVLPKEAGRSDVSRRLVRRN